METKRKLKALRDKIKSKSCRIQAELTQSIEKVYETIMEKIVISEK